MPLLSRTETLARMQEVMGPLPSPTPNLPLDIRTERVEDFPTYTRHKITYQTDPGDHVPAWLMIPRKPAIRAVLCVHSTQRSGKDEVVGMGQRFSRHTAKELTE